MKSKILLEKLKTRARALNLKFYLSFRIKLILIFAVIILLLTIVGIISFITQRKMIDKLNLMAETTITANEVVQLASEIPYTLTHYELYIHERDINIINQSVSKMKNKLEFLNKNVHGDGKLSFYTLKGLTENFFKLIHDSINHLNNSGKLEETDYLFSLNQTLSSIRNTVQQLIANELSYYLIQKADLDRQSTFVGIFTILGFIVIAGLCMTIAILYINRVSDTIVGIAQSASRIADGDLQVQSYNIKSKDEISILAQSFNKMAENLKSIIGGINFHSSEVAIAAEHLKICAEQSSSASEQILITVQQFSQGASDQAAESRRTAEAVTRLFQGNQRIIQNADEVLVAAGRADQAARDGSAKIIGLINQTAKIEAKISSIQLVLNITIKYHPNVI